MQRVVDELRAYSNEVQVEGGVTRSTMIITLANSRGGSDNITAVMVTTCEVYATDRCEAASHLLPSGLEFAWFFHVCKPPKTLNREEMLTSERPAFRLQLLARLPPHPCHYRCEVAHSDTRAHKGRAT